MVKNPKQTSHQYVNKETIKVVLLHLGSKMTWSLKYSFIHYFYHIKAQASLTSIPKRLTLPVFDGEEEQNGATVEVISNEPRDRRSISTPEPVHDDDDDTPLDQLQKGSLPDLVKNIQEKSTSKLQPVILPVPPPSKPPPAVLTVSPKPAESLSDRKSVV